MTNSVQLIAAYHKQGPKYQIPGGVRSLGCMTRRPGLIGEELHEQQRSKHAHLNLKERSRRSGLVALLLQMIDVLAAATYLSQALDPTIAVIVFVTVSLYIPMTIYITEWREPEEGDEQGGPGEFLWPGATGTRHWILDHGLDPSSRVDRGCCQRHVPSLICWSISAHFVQYRQLRRFRRETDTRRPSLA